MLLQNPIKIIIKTLMIVITFCAFCWALMYTGLFLRINSPGIIKTLNLLTHTPDDYYENIIDIPIALDSSQILVTTSVFKLKYTGRYSVNIYSDKITASNAGKISQHPVGKTIKLNLDFLHNGKVIKTCNVDGYLFPFVSLAGNGFSLCVFTIPESLPIRENIFCKITITESNPEFIAQYSPFRFAIKKFSDM